MPRLTWAVDEERPQDHGREALTIGLQEQFTDVLGREVITNWFNQRLLVDWINRVPVDSPRRGVHKPACAHLARVLEEPLSTPYIYIEYVLSRLREFPMST